MTVAQNIAFPLENVKTPREEILSTVTRVANGLGIAHLLNQHPGQLSGGDQQRVSLARAMVRQPDLYLMDEPLGTLDADHRMDLREFIRAQQLALGVTAIYVTHDQEEAMSLADRIVVMDEGLIRQIGSPGQIYHHPADLFVANFVCSPGMNLIEGEIHGRDPATFETSNAEIPIPTTAHRGPVTLGIRPEFVHLAQKGLNAQVSIVAYHGSHHDVHFNTAIGDLTMRTPIDVVPKPDDLVQIGFETDQIRLFEPGTGKSIL
jgi:ABC-type sugar transport system ATPase subunit